MALVVLTDYTTYRTGSTKVMSDAEFPYYEKQAEWELGRQTSGLLSSVVVSEAGVATILVGDTSYTLVLADLKGCLCELAEYLCRYEAAFNEAKGGLLASYSNDGQSGSFSTISDATKSREIRGIAKKYLSGTVLMQSGVSLWQG